MNAMRDGGPVEMVVVAAIFAAMFTAGVSGMLAERRRRRGTLPWWFTNRSGR